MSEIPHNEDELFDAAWQAALNGTLTPSQSALVFKRMGVLVEPTRPEPPTATAPTPVATEVASISAAASADLQSQMNRYVVKDLATGVNVTTLAVQDPKPSDRLRITGNDINALSEYWASGRTVDLRLLVQEIDRVIIPGFRTLLSPDAIGQLGHAPPSLTRAVHDEIMRTFLADRMERMMEKIDRGIDEMVVPLVSRIRSPRARESIVACIDIWHANRSNPYRNFYRRTARVARENPQLHAEYRVPLLELDPKYVSFGIVEGSLDLSRMGAAYSDTSEVVFLREPPQNQGVEFTDLLATIHELTHKKHAVDATRTFGLRSDAFAQRSAGIPNNVMIGLVDEDPEAIANEVELLFAHTGFGRLEVAKVGQSLGVTSERGMRVIYDVLQYGSEYFSAKRTNDEIPASFVSHVVSEYRRLGARMFQKNPKTGTLEERL